MGYNNFRLNNILRIIFLTSTIFIFFYSLYNLSLITSVLIGSLILFQIILLFNYIDKTNKKLANFLESIRLSEFTSSFHEQGLGSSFDKLTHAFNNIIKDFQSIRSEKEKHVQYLKSIVKNIDISIIAFQKNGKVEMVNEATKKLFQVNNINNIDNLKLVSPNLVHTLFNLKPGENTLIELQDEDDLLQLAIYATEFIIDNKIIVLATIKDIQHVLEEKEAESWQKLIRVLTHEIMNSITPIASLSSTINSMLTKKSKPELKEESKILNNQNIKEVQHALDTIYKRSSGLLQFVESYRNLTRIPKPNYNTFLLKKLFENIELLMQKELSENNIKINFSINPKTIKLSADEKLIEQVLINLINNSIQSLKSQKNKLITVRAFMNKREKISIQIIDNGEGILEEVIDKIFIPFFTTRPNGSGIGLSLSKQVMRMHGGSITAKSILEKETCFTLIF